MLAGALNLVGLSPARCKMHEASERKTVLIIMGAVSSDKPQNYDHG